MADRVEVAIAVLATLAAALVLVAPLIGRAGAPRWADAVMIAAAASGLGAFALAATATFRAARRGRPSDRRKEEAP